MTSDPVTDRHNQFTGLVARLPPSKRGALDVLRTLAHSPRVSTHDMDESEWLIDALKELHEGGLITAQPDAYPWHCYVPTATGKARIAGAMKGDAS
jgi:hypothetical protein